MDWLGHIANFFIFAGAVTITVAPRFSLRTPIFFSFLIGHVLWLILSLYRMDGPLIVLNSFFTIVDIFAILIRWFHYDIEGKTLALWNRIFKKA